MARTRSDDKIRALSEVWLFSSCSKRELHQVAQLCLPLSVEEGYALTTEGSSGKECFVVADGEAQVTIEGRPIGVVGPGECIGEMALLDPGPRTATVTARTPMSLYVLSTGEFQSLLGVSPAITRKIAATLAGRLRSLGEDHPY